MMLTMKSGIRSIVILLVLLNLVFFMLQWLLGADFTSSFMLIKGQALVRPWILVTSMFLHNGVYHLIVNMYVLLVFGGLVEERIGKKRFLLLYFISGIVASFIGNFIYSAALGASGAVFGVLGALVMVMPHLKVYPMFVPVPVRLWIVLILFTIIDVLFFPNVAVLAHITGGIVGLLFGFWLNKQKKKFIKKFSSKKHLGSKDIDEYLRDGMV